MKKNKSTKKKRLTKTQAKILKEKILKSIIENAIKK